MPPVSCRPDATVRKNPEDNSVLLKVDIKTKQGKSNNKTISLYYSVFSEGSLGDLMRFLTLLQNNIKGWSLTTDTKIYATTKNIQAGEALQIFEHQAWKIGNKNTVNYKLFIEDMVTHFFLTKAWQWQKRYIRWGMFQPWDSKILELICRVNEMVEYLEHFSPFRQDTGFT